VPKVSILLPSLNAREFLEARVRSIVDQTFTEWETIVLDSGSTDGTWEYFQSIAAKDSRFHLHQVAREGLYAALNRGFEPATGEFLHVATADDSMASNFLAGMLDALARCPQAGIAACDVTFINRAGNDLTLDDLRPHLSRRAAENLLRLDRVRTGVPDEAANALNYRPVPYDCLLHFDGRSVYYSLNQLLIRTEAARAAGLFQTNIGSVADFDWLLRLTSATGTVHVPKKLAAWRFHGNQLSMQRDESRAGSRRAAAERALVDLCGKNPGLLSENDRAALLIPLQTSSSLLKFARTLFRLARMLIENPVATMRALWRTKFRFGTRRHTLLPMIFARLRLEPKKLRG
jgi:glycosyltransferase involved in cell wall biosynthesis